MLDDSSTYNLFTSLPSGPVCGVTSLLPNNSLDALHQLLSGKVKKKPKPEFDD